MILNTNEYEERVDQGVDRGVRRYVESSGVPPSSLCNKAMELLSSGCMQVNPRGEVKILPEQQPACNSDSPDDVA